MSPETIRVRPLQRKIKKTRVQKLNGPFKCDFSITQIMEIRADKTSTIKELSVKYGRDEYKIKAVKSGKHLSHCAKRNRRDDRIKSIWG
jgi:hypothetical protein